MKLSVWAKQQGVSYRTAWRWWKEGKLPVTAEQMPTGTVIIHDKEVSS
ncbi:MAG: IS607 family transposase, partial [Nitrospirae bacterium]|nr:IS607 family transposase [Nitrospirota bacterium]